MDIPTKQNSVILTKKYLLYENLINFRTNRTLKAIVVRTEVSSDAEKNIEKKTILEIIEKIKEEISKKTILSVIYNGVQGK